MNPWLSDFVSMNSDGETTATIDPTVLALVSVFGGALFTIAGGLLGAWIQGRREHARWLKERRYEAYVEMSTLLRAVQLALHRSDEGDTKATARQFDELWNRLPGASAPLAVLGPDAVDKAAKDLLKAVPGDRAAVALAERTLYTTMRKTLDVPS